MMDFDDLTDFVRQSNMIEGEPSEPGHPLFDNYLVLAQETARKVYNQLDTVPEILDLHQYLLASQPTKFPGELRQCSIYVGGAEKMPPTQVRHEMYQLTDLIGDGPETMDPEAWCWEMHHRFEWIHPFIDGNGRIGRLLLNILRMRHGLPWLTVRYEDRFAYYRTIEGWEHCHELENAS